MIEKIHLAQNVTDVSFFVVLMKYLERMGPGAMAFKDIVIARNEEGLLQLC